MNWDEVKVVALELSNYCPMASQHPQCPASLVKELTILSIFSVRRVLFELKAHDYKGTINLHRYNEPMADPRLFSILRICRDHLPHAHPAISTNAQFLNQDVLLELVGAGLERLHVSLYGSRSKREELAEKVRCWTRHFPELEVILPNPINKPLIDNFLQIYEAPCLDLDKSCGEPLSQINISCQGDVVLCCRDWQNRYKFGNVGLHSLNNIIESDEFQRIHSLLSAGDRSATELCRRCATAR